MKTVNRISDNIGATFSPLIRIGRASDYNRKTQLYYAPQFEFVWRRTKINTIYTEITIIDSNLVRRNRPISGTINFTPSNEVIPINIYDFYMGFAGFLLNHANSLISIRVQASAGINFSYIAENKRSNSNTTLSAYTRKFGFWSYVRAWIIEPNSGLTFGAEVSNTFGNSENYQPYYNVTLSKAINLNALGAIFKPVITR